MMPGEPTGEAASSTQSPGAVIAERFFGRVHETGRLAHAYLLVGPPGSGKRSFARQLAAALLCERGGCGSCSTCSALEHGNHPGVHRYGIPEGKRQVDIDTVRTLCSRTHYRHDGMQVVVLEDADRLNEPAANALLKTLEEPPPRVVLVLIARSVATLPSTIVSRCHRVPFVAAEGVESPFSPAQAEAFAVVFTPAFFAELTPRAWMTALYPEAQGAKPALGDLLEALLLYVRLQLEFLVEDALDPALRFLERLQELSLDLERNVQADLVLEELIRALREARGASFLDGLRSPA